MVLALRIVAADSAAALLDEKFNPTHLVASVVVLVEEPYREAHTRLSQSLFKEVDETYDVIVTEAHLCLWMSCPPWSW